MAICVIEFFTTSSSVDVHTVQVTRKRNSYPYRRKLTLEYWKLNIRKCQYLLHPNYRENLTNSWHVSPRIIVEHTVHPLDRHHWLHGSERFHVWNYINRFFAQIEFDTDLTL